MTPEERAAAYQAALQRMSAANDAIQALTADATDEQRDAAHAEFTAASAECRRLREQVQRDRELEEARANAPIAPNDDHENRNGSGGDVRVTREPLTYSRENQRSSYFLDLARAEILNDGAARTRLNRHADEMQVEFRAREERRQRQFDRGIDELLSDLPEPLARAVQAAVVVESRDLSRTDTAGGDFVPPIWLLDEYAEFARAGRPFMNRVRRIPLPAGTDTINVPRITTGGATATQQDGGTVQQTDLVTATVAAPVVTIAGQQTVALQLLEQSPIAFDEVVFADLIADYNFRLEVQGITGSGSGGNMLGILNVSGINAITYTDASPTVPELYPKIADGLRQAREARKLPITDGWIAPRRAYWVTAALDSQNRPLVVPSVQGPTNALGVPQPGAGGGSDEDFALNMLVPHRMTDAIPTNLGAGTNEDRIILTRMSDHILFEGQLRARALKETKGDKLQVLLQVYAYDAFTAGRYPAATSVIAGTGLVTPTF